jgi:hypothetical protein
LTYLVMLIVCYGGNPDLCKSVQIATAPTIKECTTVGIDSISTWTRDHPGWGFERIECKRRNGGTHTNASI